MRKATLLVALTIATSGCAFSDTIRPNEGQSFEVVDRSYSEVWNAGVLTVGAIGEITSTNRAAGEIRGFKGASVWSWGNALGVFINPPSDDARNFRVSVVGIKTVRGQLAGSDYTGTMMAMMQAHLDAARGAQ